MDRHLNLPEPVANDGIQMHGYWTVTVTNPDGMVAAVDGFDNMLSPYGGDYLTALLAGETTVDGSMWKIRLEGPTISDNDSPLAYQEATSIGSFWTDIPAVPTRNRLVASSPLTLAGVCTVQTTETTVMVNEVHSTFRANPPTAITGASGLTAGGTLTRHSLDEDIMVANNQSLSFNVVISCS